MARTKGTVRTSTGSKAPRPSRPGTATSQAGPSNTAPDAPAAVTSSGVTTRKRARLMEEGVQAAGTSKASHARLRMEPDSPPDKWSVAELNVLLEALKALGRVHVEDLMDYPALRVRGRQSVLKKFNEIIGQAAAIVEAQDLHETLKTLP